MRRLNKTMRSKLQRKQRSRRLSRHRKTRRHRQKQRGGDLPVPAGAIVAVSTGGEYGFPVLMSKEVFEQVKDGLED